MDPIKARVTLEFEVELDAHLPPGVAETIRAALDSTFLAEIDEKVQELAPQPEGFLPPWTLPPTVKLEVLPEPQRELVLNAIDAALEDVLRVSYGYASGYEEHVAWIVPDHHSFDYGSIYLWEEPPGHEWRHEEATDSAD